jgi:hypothetical protein
MKQYILPAAMLVIAAAITMFGTPSQAADLPDHKITPGVTRLVDLKTICTPGSSKAARHTPQAVKEAVYRAYGVKTRKPGEFEIDHLISLELGGADVQKNLWPQSYITAPWNAHVKDHLENFLHDEVCAGRIPLKTAQHEIATDWIGSYRKHLGNP